MASRLGEHNVPILFPIRPESIAIPPQPKLATSAELGIDQRADGRLELRYTRTRERGGYGGALIDERRTNSLSAERVAGLTEALAAARR